MNCWTTLAPTLVAAAVLLASAPVHAQTSERTVDCHAISPTQRVVVKRTDGTSIRAALLCLTADEMILAGGTGLTRQPLSDVSRIATEADPIWDGAAKGAAVPLIMWAVFCHRCPAEMWVRSMATYGLIGLTFDALQSHRRTLYTAADRPRASTMPTAVVGWRVRF